MVLMRKGANEKIQTYVYSKLNNYKNEQQIYGQRNWKNYDKLIIQIV